MSPTQTARSRLAPSRIEGTLLVPGATKSARSEAAFSGLLYSVAPELLVTVRSRKSASSPAYSRKPTVPAG